MSLEVIHSGGAGSFRAPSQTLGLWMSTVASKCAGNRMWEQPKDLTWCLVRPPFLLFSFPFVLCFHFLIEVEGTTNILIWNF